MNYRSFSLYECLIALFVLSFLMEILISVNEVVLQMKEDNELAQDLMAAQQLRILLALAEEVNITDDEITYRLDDQEFELYLVNRRFIITPGTQILFEDIDDIAFEPEEDKTYAYIYKNGDVHKVRIY